MHLVADPSINFVNFLIVRVTVPFKAHVSIGDLKVYEIVDAYFIFK